uniref:Uncharacterized protein n=1 Tax=Tanacetum cinerariifolium TaxID=118510 RepID=A0A6L2NNR3_TANCI|nr:hypothetical protein [Tanacetum cinerariifolium]
MATEPNDARLQILMKLREKFDMETALEEEMMNMFLRFCDRIRLHRAEIIRLGLQSDNLLVDHGRNCFGRLTGADMRNASHMMLAREELL